MYVDLARMGAAEARFGLPSEVKVHQEILPWEMDLIERVCGNVRFHDVTIFILRDGEMALVHKPSEPPGAFWAPTGGAHPGEELVDAVLREAWEETGMEVAPVRYALRMRTVFSCGERRRPWISHVFVCRHVSGEPNPIDTEEIELAAWVSFSRFREEVAPVLLASGWGRFRYRLKISERLYDQLGVPAGWWPSASRPKGAGKATTLVGQE